MAATHGGCKRYWTPLASLCQSVSGPTHKDGHTLDVVISRADLPQPTIDIRSCDEYSDHSLVLFQLRLPRPPLRFVDVSTRAWKNFDSDKFRQDLLESHLCQRPDDMHTMPADVLQDIYDSTSIDIAQQARTAEGRTSTSSTDHPVVR